MVLATSSRMGAVAFIYSSGGCSDSLFIFLLVASCDNGCDLKLAVAVDMLQVCKCDLSWVRAFLHYPQVASLYRDSGLFFNTSELSPRCGFWFLAGNYFVSDVSVTTN